MRLLGCKLKIVVPIARDHNASGLLRCSEDERVIRFRREHIAQDGCFMAMAAKSICDRVVDVVVEEEFHSAGGDICATARRSISVRWSS